MGHRWRLVAPGGERGGPLATLETLCASQQPLPFGLLSQDCWIAVIFARIHVIARCSGARHFPPGQAASGVWRGVGWKQNRPANVGAFPWRNLVFERTQMMIDFRPLPRLHIALCGSTQHCASRSIPEWPSNTFDVRIFEPPALHSDNASQIDPQFGRTSTLPVGPGPN